MSTKDQLLYSALHGTAMRYAAERRNLDESIEELRDIADGRNDILTQAAGITAGSWYAWPSTHIGHELIAAGMLILAGGGRGLPLDYDELERWTRVGFARCQWPSSDPRWWPTQSPHSSGVSQWLLILVPPRARACFMR
jgi:hypothetical protein